MKLINQKIKIHPSGPEVSRLVYGAWRINDGNDTDTELSRLFGECIESGVTWFDHADIYGDYSCEERFGKILNQNPEWKKKISIVTKTNIQLISDQFPDRKIKSYNTDPDYIRKSVETSLKKLGVEYLDILLLHRQDPLMDPSLTGSCLDSLVQEGKIRFAGVSNFTPSHFTMLQSKMKNPLVTNQIEINPLRLDPFWNGDLDFCLEKGISPMAWSPLGGGKIFSKTEWKDRLGAFAKARGISVSAWILAWLLRHPAGIIPVLGTTKLDRLREMLESWNHLLDREEWFAGLELFSGTEVP
jgi:predicted oxidoreductase